MKLEIQREQFLQLLQSVVGVVERRQTLAILGNVLIIAETNSLSITATDLEVELSASCQLDIAEEGKITVPGRKLLEILRALPEDTTVTLTQAQNKALIRGLSSRFQLASLPAEEFPALDDFNAEGEIRLPQVQLKSLIERTQFAMAQQDVRYYLNGLMLEFVDGSVRAVATDGHRLAFCQINLTQDNAPDQGDDNATRQIIVPRKGIQELARLLTDSDTEALVRIGHTHILIELDAIRFVSKLIDGKFPDYRRAIPDEGDRFMLAGRLALREALARTAILAGDNRGVRMLLENDQLRIQANNPEQEQAEEDLAVGYPHQEPLEIGFNVGYLLDALGSLSGDQTKLFLADSASSCLLRSPDDEHCKYVVSPMRL